MKSLFAFTAALLMAAASLASAAQDGPSFSCAKAKAPDEIAICADTNLSALDLTINVIGG